MGFLSRQPDDEPGEPLGNRPIASFIRPSSVVKGGERPAVIDTSRPGNEPTGGKFAWSKKAIPVQGEPKSPADIQDSYDSLFQ